MHFEPYTPYHLYNRGVNDQQIFFAERNYAFFLRKVKKEWRNLCTIETYCLMPDHFHFICIPNETACIPLVYGGKESHLQLFSFAVGHTLSSYARAINLQERRSGALFRKKSQSALLLEGFGDGRFTTRHYDSCKEFIEYNPVQAGLVKHIADWKWSSVRDILHLLPTVRV